MGYLPHPGSPSNRYPTLNTSLAGYNVTNDSGAWAWQILPFIEQDNLYKSFSANTLNQTPTATQILPLQPFLCPGRGRPGVATTGGTVGPMTDYAMNVMVNDPTTYGLSGRGNNKRRVETISDGSSSTIAVGHKYVQRSQYSRNSGDGWDEVLYVSNGGANRGYSWMLQDGTLGANGQWGAPFPSGAIFAMYDGSVRSIRYSITQNGGTTVPTTANLPAGSGTSNALGCLLNGSDGNVVSDE